MAAANDLQKRGLLKDPMAKRALSEATTLHLQFSRLNLTSLASKVNKRGLLAGMTTGIPSSISDLLQTLDLPTPQPIGLAPVPDKDHPFIAPGPTDVRGLCPTLNTMGANPLPILTTRR